MKVFGGLEMAYHNTSDQNAGSQFDTYLPTDMAEMKMMIETRPRYPSNKLTFTIANLTKGKTFPRINIILNLNAKLDADVDLDAILEDSKRNFLNSFLFCFVF